MKTFKYYVVRYQSKMTFNNVLIMEKFATFPSKRKLLRVLCKRVVDYDCFYTKRERYLRMIYAVRMYWPKAHTRPEKISRSREEWIRDGWRKDFGGALSGAHTQIAVHE